MDTTGPKGTRNMAISAEFRDHLLELLDPLGGVEARRMFGGAGLFRRNLMFALIVGDVVYLKTDPTTRAAFEARGKGPFAYDTKQGRRVIAGLHELPEELFDEPDELVEWARTAFEVACRADAAKSPSKRKRV
ncbi:transcriptional regulator [Minwuia thermotolerans]|uniref:Transcriptional regulator n=2 Tax=Minwuia thermotolerans TaxID=2056226 RepID=A0A2M9FYN2_9PROT|nr:transcriptional regulator [Minwuia thermotolerans]